jgi:hypothetical protein
MHCSRAVTNPRCHDILLPRAAEFAKPNLSRMTETAQPPAPVPPSIYSRTFVLGSILLSILLFFCAASFIAYRWLITTEPSALLIVDANQLLQGATVSVKSTEEEDTKSQTVGVGNRFSVPFYLDPGTYTLSIRLRETNIYTGEFTLRHNEVGRFDLTKWEPQPTSRPFLQQNP